MRESRESSIREHASFFVSTQTAHRQPFFRHERWANLARETIEHYGNSGYWLHAYVIMPDHIHVLMTPHDTLEKAVQLIKGGFSFRAKRAFDWKSEIWQPGFSDHRIRDDADWRTHHAYISSNPIRARLVERTKDYPHVAFPAPEFPQGLKPPAIPESSTCGLKPAPFNTTEFPQGLKPGLIPETSNVRAEARTLHDDRTLQHNRVPSAAKGRLIPETSNVRAETRTLQHEGSLQPDRTLRHGGTLQHDEIRGNEAWRPLK